MSAFAAVIALFVPQGWREIRAALAERRKTPWQPTTGL
jgi:hypothetical protein